MKESVHSLTDAENWFIKHPIGSVLCVQGDRQKECQSYPEAKRFFEPYETPVSTPTEQDEDDGLNLAGLAGAALLEEAATPDPEPVSEPDPVPDGSFESGGGDFGGAGGGSDW